MKHPHLGAIGRGIRVVIFIWQGGRIQIYLWKGLCKKSSIQITVASTKSRCQITSIINRLIWSKDGDTPLSPSLMQTWRSHLSKSKWGPGLKCNSDWGSRNKAGSSMLPNVKRIWSLLSGVKLLHHYLMLRSSSQQQGHNAPRAKQCVSWR